MLTAQIVGHFTMQRMQLQYMPW